MTKIHQQVMASVAAIYVVRRLTNPRALKAYALCVSFVGILFFASVPHVMTNFMHVEGAGLPGMSTFVLTAVAKTNLVVQLALILGAVALASLMRDVVRPQRRFA